MASPSTPYYTDEQWQQLLKLQDLTGQEQAIAQQQALANQLRQGGGNRIDTASQIGRGMSGIGSALMNYRAMKGMQDLSKARKDWLAAQGPQGRGSLPIAPPSVSNYDPAQFSDFTGGYGVG